MFEKIKEKAENLLNLILSDKGDFEQKISDNYKAINSCYLNINKLNEIKKELKDNEYLELLNLYKKIIDFSLGNLSFLSTSLKPKELDNSLNLIKKELNIEESYSFIFPYNDAFIFTFIIPYNNKNIVLSNIYYNKEEEIYLNYLPYQILPGKYELGKKIESKNIILELKELLKNNSLNPLCYIIKKTEIFNKFIEITPKEDLSLEKIKKILIYYLNNNIKQCFIKKGKIYLLLKIIYNSDLIRIASYLNINYQDLYKLLNRR